MLGNTRLLKDMDVGVCIQCELEFLVQSAYVLVRRHFVMTFYTLSINLFLLFILGICQM